MSTLLNMYMALFILIIFFACLLQGIVGFGVNFVAAPLALAFFDKETVVSSLTVVSIVLGVVMIRQVETPLNYRVFLLLFVTSLLGMPIGILILQLIPLNGLKVTVGVISLFSAIVLVLPRIKLSKKPLLILFTGFLAGILATSTSTSGTPPVLLLSGIGIPKDEMRKILAAFFCSMGVAAFVLFIFSNVFTLQRIMPGVISIPIIFLAGYLGNKISHRIPPHLYRGLGLVIIGMTSLYGIYSGLQR